MSAESRSNKSDFQELAKNLLYCPHCPHASNITGDWTLEVHETECDSLLVYRCPECSKVVTRRPRPD